MSAALKAAALAITELVQECEAKRGEPLQATFRNPMMNGALTTNTLGIPVPMLKALVNATTERPLAGAAQHILRMMQRDGRLAYLIGPGSQSYELLTKEAAAAAGQDVTAFRSNFEATVQPEPWPSEHRIRRKIEEAVEEAVKNVRQGVMG